MVVAMQMLFVPLIVRQIESDVLARPDTPIQARAQRLSVQVIVIN